MATSKKKKKDKGRNVGMMGIDKAHSRPWVKITVWTLTGALIVAWLGGGIMYLIMGDTPPPAIDAIDVEQLNLVYGEAVTSLEASRAADPDDLDVARQLASYYASWAQQLYETGDVANYPHAIELIEKAMDLEPELREPGNRLISVMQADM